MFSKKLSRSGKKLAFGVALLLLVSAVTAGGFGWYRVKYLTPSVPQAPEHFVNATPQDAISPTQAPSVLGTSDANIGIQTKTNGWSNGGLLVLNAAEKSSVFVSSYNASGQGDFKLYKVSRNDLLNYLVYRKQSTDDGYNSIEKVFAIDTKSLTLATSFQQHILSSNGQSFQNEMVLPIEGTGIWFLQGTVGSSKVETMLVRTNLGGIVHEGDNQNVFWAQDTRTNSVSDATFDLLNLENSVTSLGQLTTDQNGLANSSVNGALDIAVLSKGDDSTVLPVNLVNLNYRYTGNSRFSSSFSQRQVGNKSFFFTDRFLYQPGDTVNFKDIIRNDDDANYTISPRTYSVTFSFGDAVIWQKSFSLSEVGSIDGSIPIPKDAKAGYYSLSIKEGDTLLESNGVQVAQFRKPDASVSINTDKMMYLPGETLTAAITGSTFLGQPIKNQEVRYKVYQQEAKYLTGDFEQLSFQPNQKGFTGQGQDTSIAEGSVTLDGTGKAKFTLPVKNTTGFRQFWVIHIEYLDQSGVTADDAIQALIQPGDFVIGVQNQSQRFTVDKENTVALILHKNKVGADLNNISITGTLKRNNGSGGYIVEQSNLKATSDQTGHVSFSVTPHEKNNYFFETETHDKVGNLIKGEMSLYASLATDENNTPVDIFTIKKDKETYNVGDTAHFTIQTRPEIKTIFASIGRVYSRDYRVLPVSNGVASFDLPITEKFQPNVYLQVGTFQTSSWVSETVDVPVNTNDKKVTIKITPSQSTYGPAETAMFDIQATDGQGRPVKTDLAFWIFDKALLELHGNYFEGIFKNFWDERYFGILTNFSYQGILSNGAEGGGGCFTGDTLVTMADGTQKKISQISKGEQIQTYSSLDTKQKISAKVVATHQATVDGYLIVNDGLKVTPEHKLLVNGQWKTAGEISVGDTLLSDEGNAVTVTSIEWIRGKFIVYNLQIEKFHTFFANDIYVHNDKGDSRSVFKDTAYWNPHVTTGDDGKARVTVVLPDNLTTWVAAAVSANTFTQVGDGKTEFTVTKDIVTRPILPSFLRIGDQFNLSALLFNYTSSIEKFAVTASFTAGNLTQNTQEVSVHSGDLAQLYWPVTVTGGSDLGIFKVSSKGTTNTKLVDEVSQKLPVFVYGSPITTYAKGQNESHTILILNKGTDPAQLSAVLKLRASRYPEFKSLLGSLISGSNYGVDKSAAVLVAASIYSANGKELGFSAPADLNTSVKKAVQILKENQNDAGYWPDGYGDISLNQTRMAMEGLFTAKNAGFSIDQAVLDKALAYMKQWHPGSPAYLSDQQYIYSLFPTAQLDRKQIDLKTLNTPATIARATIANKRQGFVNSTTEEQVIMGSAHQTPTQVAWLDPNKKTWLDIAIPTSWMIRAMEELQVSADKYPLVLDYLYRNQSNDLESMMAQALATVSYYKSSNQLSPNYQYQVSLGGKLLQSEQVTSLQQELSTVQLKKDDFDNGATLDIYMTNNKAGQLFTQMEQTEFYTAHDVLAQNQNLHITRKYLSTKPTGEPTQVGDLVIVQFQVGGLGQGETNVNIEDYLPSGLVAIDQTLDNGNFDQNLNVGAAQEITPQGMKLNFSHLFSDDGTYSYKTRVVSEGTYDTPPAVIWLQNDPTIWANTNADRLVVDGKHALDTSMPKAAPFTMSTAISNRRYLVIAGIIFAMIVIIIAVIGYIKRVQLKTFIQRIRNRKRRGPIEIPPNTPVSSEPSNDQTPPVPKSPPPQT